MVFPFKSLGKVSINFAISNSLPRLLNCVKHLPASKLFTYYNNDMPKTNRHQQIWILFLLTISIAVSIAISSNKSVWRDEAFSYLIAKQDIRSIFSTAAKDFTPPLYYVLLHPLVKIFGSHEVILRLLSLMPVLILQLLLAKEVRNYFPKNAKLMSNLLMLVIFTQPLLLYFSVELRAYSLAMLLTYLVFASSANLFKSRSSVVTYIAAQAALLYTHNLGIFFWVTQFITLSFIWLSRRDWQNLKRFIMANILIGVLYLPWMPILLSQVNARSAESWFTFHPLTSLHTLQNLFVFNELSLQLPKVYEYFSRISLFFALLGFVSSLPLIAKRIFPSPGNHSQNTIDVAQHTQRAFLLGIFTFGSLYVYSWVSQPVLYGRYVAFLFSLSFFSVLFSWKLLAARFYKTGGILVALYAIFQLMVTGHLFYGLNKSDYKSLRQYHDFSLYTDSDLDIMPCLYYHPSCVYVGDKTDSPTYTGINQLTTIPDVVNWSQVLEREVILIQRNTTMIPKELPSRYTHIYTHDLGDTVSITRLSIK